LRGDPVANARFARVASTTGRIAGTSLARVQSVNTGGRGSLELASPEIWTATNLEREGLPERHETPDTERR